MGSTASACPLRRTTRTLRLHVVLLCCHLEAGTRMDLELEISRGIVMVVSFTG